MNMKTNPPRERFRLDEQTKEARAENLRRRFQAATPPTRKAQFQLPRLPADWRRASFAAVLAVILLLVWLR
jgi:hypothetical protein